MATYAFKAIDLAGAPTNGELDAGDKQAVAQNLRARSLIVLDIEELKPASAGDLLARFKKVKARDLTVATRQFSSMVSSGMSLLRSLYVLEEQVESEQLKEALVAIRGDVEAGISLSDSLAKHPRIFNELYTAMVAAGETGGILDETLHRVADQLEKDDALRRQVRAAMMYPGFVGGFALVVLLALVAFIVPVFEKVFKDFGGELPAITKVSVGASHLVTGRWYLLIGGTVLAIYAFRKWKNTERGQVQWDTFKFKLPMKIGGIIQKVALARFSRTYAALVGAGVPMLEAIEITGRTSGNKVVELAMQAVHDSVRRGGTIAEPMRLAPQAFPPMVAVGEETGGLDHMLSKVADFYEDEVAAAVKALTSIIEPVMIVLVGVIVGFIVISMYMPMFKVYDQIK